MKYRNAEQKIQEILSTKPAIIALQRVVDFLFNEFEHYSWVGIYFVKGNVLVLGPWKGKQATEHTTIPLGEGICGAAAQTGKTERVDDVSMDERYLSCFLSTRSELVVPIKNAQDILGEVDIDSDKPAAFDFHDVMFLEKVADMLSSHI